MAKHQLYFGGTRMGARDLWSSSGQGYWPASVPEAKTHYDYGISGHQSDGRQFFAERLLHPEELGDEALLSYLNSFAASPAVSDELHVMMIPIGSVVEGATVEVFSLPTGMAVSVNLVNLNDGTVAVPLTSLSAPDAGTTKTAMMPSPYATGDNNHMVVVQLQAVPAAGTLNWEQLNIRINVQGHPNYSGGGYLDTKQVTVFNTPTT